MFKNLGEGFEIGSKRMVYKTGAMYYLTKSCSKSGHRVPSKIYHKKTSQKKFHCKADNEVLMELQSY